MAEKTDCVLGSDSGHPPGPKASWAVEEPDDICDGVAVVTKKTVFQAGENGPPHFLCPGCNTQLIDKYFNPSDDTPGKAFMVAWLNCAGKWWKSESDEATEVACPECGHSERFDQWPCENPWAFGHCGLTFWNWPPLKTELMDRLQHVTGERAVRVWGHI